MPAFIPVIYLLGGIALRATTAVIARQLAKEGAKKVARSAMSRVLKNKKIVDVTKTNIDKFIKAAEKAKPSNLKSGGKKITKPRDVKSTTKPTVKPPKKATTKQKNTTPNKPTVNKTSTTPRTTKTTPTQSTTPKPVKKPSNIPRNITIVSAIGGAGYLLDNLVDRKDKPVKVDKTTDRPKSKTVVSDRVAVKTGTKKAKSKVIPKDTEAILSKIAEPKPKSNLSKFGRAFKNARKQGRYSFNYNGKEITTRFKEETVAEHKKKFGKK